MSETYVIPNDDARAQRGHDIAQSLTIRKNGSGFVVPSQSGKGTYLVDPNTSSCTCPDYEIRHKKCKHIFAVEYRLRQETNDKGETTVTQSVKVTYKQNWPAYNAATTTEKHNFVALLHDLCQGIPEPVQTFGRPRLPLSDMVFATAFKVYSTFSGRRFMSDLEDAHAKGYISKMPRHSSLFNYLEMPALTPIFRDLITESSLPLKAIESDFAVDSSGFSTSRTVTWFNKRYGHAQDNSDWLKVHLMTGVQTNIVTSLEISGRHAHDAPYMPSLVDATARNFDLREVSADKAYSSRKNLAVVTKHGATPYIPFKSSATGDGFGNELWQRMYHYYSYNRADFLAHYHKRSNVETTFSMIKAKFGDSIKAKTDVAQVNELLAKVLCHNICVVIQSIYELGIDATFWTENALVQNVALN